MASSVRIFRDIPSIREYRRSLLLAGKTVGFVPTMGALHEGHLSLMRQAAEENTHVFASIYVNPTQFGVNEDLSTYPRTWDSDIKVIEDLDASLTVAPSRPNPPGRVSAVFAPTTKTMYPNLPPSSELDGLGSFVTITPLASKLEGASRPIFFRGVATVCMKLFNIITPDRVYFGQKDFQQTAIIRRMVDDLCVGTVVRIGSTVREPDGLAMSSRNVYLGRRRRSVAIVLYDALRLAEEQYAKGHGARSDILGPALELAGSRAKEQARLEAVARARFEVDYMSLADPDSLEELEQVEERKGAILSGAIKMLPLESPGGGEVCGQSGSQATVRLIDNIILEARVRSGFETFHATAARESSSTQV